jgi:Uma2 family endonuclease
MQVIEPPLVTVEEYARMESRDDARDELIEGRVVYRPLHRAMHGIVCGNASFTLGEYQDKHGGTAVIGSGVIVGRNPDSVLGPDAAYWNVRFPRELSWPDVPPGAVYEIVDKDEPFSYMSTKIRLWLRFGVGVVWVVDPWNDSVTEYRGSTVQFLRPGDTLEGGEAVPGFTCPVADLFA